MVNWLSHKLYKSKTKITFEGLSSYQKRVSVDTEIDLRGNEFQFTNVSKLKMKIRWKSLCQSAHRELRCNSILKWNVICGSTYCIYQFLQIHRKKYNFIILYWFPHLSFSVFLSCTKPVQNHNSMTKSSWKIDLKKGKIKTVLDNAIGSGRNMKYIKLHLIFPSRQHPEVLTRWCPRHQSSECAGGIKLCSTGRRTNANSGRISLHYQWMINDSRATISRECKNTIFIQRDCLA